MIKELVKESVAEFNGKVIKLKTNENLGNALKLALKNVL